MIRGHKEHSGHGTNSCPGDNMIPLIDELISRASQGSSGSTGGGSTTTGGSSGSTGGGGTTTGGSSGSSGSSGGGGDTNFQSNSGCAAAQGGGPAGPLTLVALVMLGLVGVRRRAHSTGRA